MRRWSWLVLMMGCAETPTDAQLEVWDKLGIEPLSHREFMQSCNHARSDDAMSDCVAEQLGMAKAHVDACAVAAGVPRAITEQPWWETEPAMALEETYVDVQSQLSWVTLGCRILDLRRTHVHRALEQGHGLSTCVEFLDVDR